MIVTVTPTAMSGTVVRWYHPSAIDSPSQQPLITASRNGVKVSAWLHDAPNLIELIKVARNIYVALLDFGSPDSVSHLATHRRVPGGFQLIERGREAVSHGHTRHGHKCCDLVNDSRSRLVARCGGPALCQECGKQVRLIHTGTSAVSNG